MDKRIKELESWINREINISLNQIEKSTHYVKARNEAYVLALKKIQSKLRVFHTHGMGD